jgi:hypothetical protein
MAYAGREYRMFTCHLYLYPDKLYNGDKRKPNLNETIITLAASGAKLHSLHLMEDVEPQTGLADFPIDGSNEIESIQYIGGSVHINARQYFDGVPSESWNFYIGGYQPAQKWLKDRKGRILAYDDIRHYKRIIRVLKETHEIIRELDSI